MDVELGMLEMRWDVTVIEVGVVHPSSRSSESRRNSALVRHELVSQQALRDLAVQQMGQAEVPKRKVFLARFVDDLSRSDESKTMKSHQQKAPFLLNRCLEEQGRTVGLGRHLRGPYTEPITKYGHGATPLPDFAVVIFPWSR